MTRPSLMTRLLGHPLIVAATGAATLWTILAWTQGGDGRVALLAAVALSAVVKASQRRSAYLTFRREWDGLAPSASARPARRARTFLIVSLVVLLVAAAVCYLVLTIEQPGHALALGAITVVAGVTAIVVSVIAAVRAIMRALARRRVRHAARMVPVAVSVTRPLLPVPSLTDAYRALPAYCWTILS